jgi:hypothetical protein
VRAGGVAVGSIGAASLLGVGGLERALAAGTTSLSGPRRATYSALVEAVGLAGTTDVESSRAPAATREFEALYSDAVPEWRECVDITLDQIEAGPGGPGFAAAPAKTRLKHLRGWEHGDAKAAVQGRPWQAIAANAVIFAALPFYPHGADGPAAI